MKIYEIMQKNVYTVAPSDSIQKTIKLMKDMNLGFVVILENKIPVGVITDRDLLLVLEREINLKICRNN